MATNLSSLKNLLCCASMKLPKKTYAEKKISKINVQETIIRQQEDFLAAVKKELAAVPEINAVVLFGSLARGDYSLRHSDIDLMIFIDQEKKNPRLEERIRKKIILASMGKELSSQAVFQYKTVEEEDKSLLVTIAREGKVLFARRTIIISQNQAGLTSYTLIRFETAGCAPVVKNKLQRFLHGYTVKGKHYKGIIDEQRVFSAGKSAIMVPEELHTKVLHLAQDIGVKVISKGRFYK